MSHRFLDLPWLDNAEGQPRRVGIEIEMAGVELTEIGAAVVAEFGGRLERESAFLLYVRESKVGEFRLELDSGMLKDRTYRDHLRWLGIELAAEDQAGLEEWLAGVAGILVPHELVAPPLPVTELPRLDRVRAALQRQGALGTAAGLLYAFGLQLNIEVHRLEAPWILNILRAFVLHHEILAASDAVDLARRLSPYIRPFPGAYVRKILAPDYTPTTGKLIDDYLLHNPTRNRPLDLLPLFAFIDRPRVMAAEVEHRLIRPRPALHYRLPDCRIDDPAWTLAHPYNGWAAIEQLAATQRLGVIAAEFLERPNQLIGRLADQWGQRLSQWF